MTRKIVGCPSDWYQYTLALKQIPLPAQHIPVPRPKQMNAHVPLIHLDTWASLDRSDQFQKFWQLYPYGHHGLHNLLLSIPSEGAHATILRMIRQSSKFSNTAHDGYVQNAGGYTLTLQSRKQFQKHWLYIGPAWNNELAHGPCICTNSLKESFFELIRMLKVRPKKHNLWTLYSMGETSEISQTDNTVHDLNWTCVSNLIRCCSKLTASWPTSCWTEILFLGVWPQTKFHRCWWGTCCHARGEHSTPWLQIFSEHALKRNYNDWNILT